MLNHGRMLHSEKDYLNMTINQCKPWSTMFFLELIIFILGLIENKDQQLRNQRLRAFNLLYITQMNNS